MFYKSNNLLLDPGDLGIYRDNSLKRTQAQKAHPGSGSHEDGGSICQGEINVAILSKYLGCSSTLGSRSRLYPSS